ncbi:MAG: hypothetical protein P4L81_03270 [Candidatus Pacebacteria bacterium]|nr:hypothetical protein [Candidatus Paceibacterota bacterium]
MVISTAIVFFIALILIVGLFTLKRWELSHERVLFRNLRQRADAQALHLKELALAARKDVEHLPPFLLDAATSIVQGIAVDAGHLAIWLGKQSHRLADSVSHKRNFEPRETKSEFLKKVAEHKSGSEDASVERQENDNGEEELSAL